MNGSDAVAFLPNALIPANSSTRNAERHRHGCLYGWISAILKQGVMILTTSQWGRRGSSGRSRGRTGNIGSSNACITALSDFDPTEENVGFSNSPRLGANDNIRVDVVGKVLQRVSVESCKSSIVLCQLQAIVVGIGVVLDLAVGDLRNVVESVAARRLQHA